MSKVKEWPILFSTEMVRAILGGHKTQTRRVVKTQPPEDIDILHGGELRTRAPYQLEHPETGAILGHGFEDEDDVTYKVPYGMPGDRLWVRETWQEIPEMKPSVYWSNPALKNKQYWYKATDDLPTWGGKWRPSIHMPRWAARIILEITNVRVERLQDISADDVLAEGLESMEGMDDGLRRVINYCDSERGWTSFWVESFACLWDSINAKRGYPWESDPWVWVVEFRTVQG